MFLLAIIAIGIFLTITFALLAFGQRPPSELEVRAASLSQGLRPGAQAGSQLLVSSRTSTTTRSLVELARRLLPDVWYDKLERNLIGAGDPVDPGLFVLFWVTLAAAMLILGPTVLGSFIGPPKGLLIAVLIGGLGPYLWLRRAVRTRRARISHDLPDAMDLLVACVESGLALDTSLVRVGDATEGPLGDEIRLTLAEIAIGRPRQEALFELGTRAGVADLDAFLRPVIQAERAGVAIGDALRTQSRAMREGRRQRAREAAEKIPAKMTIPMVAFFLPCIMLVAIAPAILTLIKIFKGL